MTPAEGQGASRHPGIVNLRQYRLYPERPQGLEFGLEKGGAKHPPQPQQPLDDRHQLASAQIKSKGNYGIAVGDPGRAAEDQRLKGGGVLPGPTAPEVDGIAGELKFRVNRNRANRQAV